MKGMSRFPLETSDMLGQFGRASAFAHPTPSYFSGYYEPALSLIGAVRDQISPRPHHGPDHPSQEATQPCSGMLPA